MANAMHAGVAAAALSLLAILAESNPGEYSISRISMELGLMELNGLICTQHGNITITDASAT